MKRWRETRRCTPWGSLDVETGFEDISNTASSGGTCSRLREPFQQEGLNRESAAQFAGFGFTGSCYSREVKENRRTTAIPYSNRESSAAYASGHYEQSPGIGTKGSGAHIFPAPSCCGSHTTKFQLGILDPERRRRAIANNPTKKMAATEHNNMSHDLLWLCTRAFLLDHVRFSII